MARIEFVTAWERGDPRHAADAVAFWNRHGLVRPEEIEERVGELCALAYSEGQLVGLTTVTLMGYPLFKSKFAFYRAAVARDFRRHELAILLTRHTLTVMEAWSLENPQQQVQGIACIIEGKELMGKALNPVWSEYYGNLNLAGFTKDGRQVRVAWFRHARLDPPPA
jgi:hypothetical protein